MDQGIITLIVILAIGAVAVIVAFASSKAPEEPLPPPIDVRPKPETATEQATQQEPPPKPKPEAAEQQLILQELKKQTNHQRRMSRNLQFVFWVILLGIIAQFFMLLIESGSKSSYY